MVCYVSFDTYNLSDSDSVSPNPLLIHWWENDSPLTRYRIERLKDSSCLIILILTTFGAVCRLSRFISESRVRGPEQGVKDRRYIYNGQRLFQIFLRMGSLGFWQETLENSVSNIKNKLLYSCCFDSSFVLQLSQPVDVGVGVGSMFMSPHQDSSSSVINE